MTTRKFLLYLGEKNYIDCEFWYCSPSLLCSWVGKRQREAIVETAQVHEDIVDEIPVPFLARL